MNNDRFQDFVSFAIEKENEAASLYEKYAAVVESRSTRKMLEELAQMERSHEKRLRELSQGRDVSLGSQKPLPDLKISDFMVSGSLQHNSSVEEALAFAMKAEQKAYALYTKLSELETDTRTRQLFSDLASEELSHKHDLEVEYEKLVMGEN